MEILNKIQKELKAPKGQKNTFGNYNYRSCEDILEAVKPLLGDATLTLTDDVVMLGDRFYVKATATLRNGDATVEVSAFARESLDKKGMDSAQITGAASSYARKYALNGLFCIDDTKDADTQDNTQKDTIPHSAPQNAPKATVAPKKTPFETASASISKAFTAEELAELSAKVTESTRLTEEEKITLQESIEAKASLIP